jgi:hypothetical protein
MKDDEVRRSTTPCPEPHASDAGGNTKTNKHKEGDNHA